MQDPRVDHLARLLVGHSLELKQGDRVLIESFDAPPEMVRALIRESTAVAALPLVCLKDNTVLRELYRTATADQMTLIGEIESYRMDRVDAYVGLRSSANIAELSDVPADQMKLYQGLWWEPVHVRRRVPNTRWVVLRWPTPSMAQQAQMSTEAFERFYFDVCTMDYAAMARACEPLQERMQRADAVRITSPGTHLRFSIRNIPVIPCFGKRNIPDGECFTAPVKDSVSGTISYNTPTIYQGVTFEQVRLRFEAGRVVEASSSNTTRLNEILDADPGARYVGEFAIGFNPHILNPLKDILFDEKIAGSFHFTPGNAYESADNGNRSQVHWDMVLIQRPDWGGGEIWFDDVLIRKDGHFVPADLQGLNPEALLGARH